MSVTIIKIIDDIWEAGIEQHLDTNVLPYGRHFVKFAERSKEHESPFI